MLPPLLLFLLAQPRWIPRLKIYLCSPRCDGEEPAVPLPGQSALGWGWWLLLLPGHSQGQIKALLISAYL